MHITVSLSHASLWLLPEIILFGDLLLCSDRLFLHDHTHTGAETPTRVDFIHLGHTVNLVPQDSAVVVVDSIIFRQKFFLSSYPRLHGRTVLLTGML